MLKSLLCMNINDIDEDQYLGFVIEVTKPTKMINAVLFN